MKKTLFTLSLAAVFGLAVHAQIAQPVLPPGKIAVFKAGTSNGLFPIKTARSQPCYVEVFDTVTTNQVTPLVTVPMSTNVAVPGSVWINAHAGSEGGGISRSVDRQFLALQGYTGDILPANASKPSQPATYTVTTTNASTGVITTNTVGPITVTRGIVTLDAFTNAISIYSDPVNWFGIPPGSASSTQDNPTGIATTDGTNFWGTGNFAGTSAELAGTLFYNGTESSTPYQLQNQIQAAAEVRIIGGVLYFVVLPGNNAVGTPPVGFGGVFNFVQPSSGPNPGQVVPLPFDPNSSSPWLPPAPAQTNLFINWGNKFVNIANFDMNPQATIAYGADEVYGIVKFTNNAGTWVQAPYYFNPTNIGSGLQPANGGCFGICVDFSSTNPVIYATTMEYGAGTTGNSQGNPNANRLIRIVDTGVDPGTNVVAQTLAIAPSINESFRGIDFTPDLSPLIASEPANVSTTTTNVATYAVGVNSAYPVSYQWFDINGSVTNLLASQTNATLTISNLTTSLTGNAYFVVATNYYGAATSTPPAGLTVTFAAVAPTITNSVSVITQYVGNNVTFTAINPNGTQPFTYQWYQDGTPLSDANTSADGATYVGSTNNSLTISGLGTAESGNYYLAVTNLAGGIVKLVDVLSVQYQVPTIAASGQPSPVATFVGDSTYLSVTPSGGTQPFNYQWYQGSTPLSDSGDFSGSATSVLTISPAALSDSGGYSVVISNPGGSVTSSVVNVSVLVAPPLSSVAYSNQVYLQNFDSLPDPGSNSVNSFNNGIPGQFGVVSGNINGVYYALANPFDFAYPVTEGSQIGGLGLGSTLSGWYGAADSANGGFVRFGAQDGDQTTGGIIDFGLNDGEVIGAENGSELGTNRALGLLATSTTGSTTFALKLINTSGTSLNYVDVSFIAELWRHGTRSRTVSVGYTLDSTASSFVLSAQSIGNATGIGSLGFSWPAAVNPTEVDGTDPLNQTNLNSGSLQLVAPWVPNGALWLIWSINYDGVGGANGYAIDNFSFQASANPIIAVSQPVLGGVTYDTSTGLSFTFTNTAGAASQFTTWSTTNLTLPFSKWVNLGHPAEVTPGNYQVVDPSSTTNKQTFYKVTSP